MNNPTTPLPAVNPEIDVTKFVNIDSEPFDIYSNGKLVRHLEAGKTQTLPVWVAEVGAKHLVDKVLQKQGVRDTNTDNPLRRSTFAKILPEMADKYAVVPLPKEAEQTELQKILAQQDKKMETLSTKVEDVVAALTKQVAELQAKLGQDVAKKLGRPPKEKSTDEPTNP